MKEINFKVRPMSNYIEIALVNSELKNSVNNLVINYEVAMDFKQVYGSIYYQVNSILTDKSDEELGQAYDKVIFRHANTNEILFEYNLPKEDSNTGFKDLNDKPGIE